MLKVKSELNTKTWLSLGHAIAGVAVTAIVAVIAYLLQSKNVNNETIFKVVDLPGRGKGLIATRDIEQGELLIREKPLFTVPHTISSAPAQFVWNKVQNLTLVDRESYMNLSYVGLPEWVDPRTQHEEVGLAIFQTNAVSAGDSVGIFPHMARLNHGCAGSFNSVYSWREKEEVLVVHALKSIRQGQELLTTYMDTKQPRVQRRAYLAEHYGFECSCSVCSLPDELSRASDERLSKMASLYTRFSSWGTGSISGREAIEIANQIWEIGEEERYWSERGRLAADAALVAASHSDYEATRMWAETARRWYGKELGEDSWQAMEMAVAAESVEARGGWGSRKQEHVGGPAHTN